MEDVISSEEKHENYLVESPENGTGVFDTDVTVAPSQSDEEKQLILASDCVVTALNAVDLVEFLPDEKFSYFDFSHLEKDLGKIAQTASSLGASLETKLAELEKVINKIGLLKGRVEGSRQSGFAGEGGTAKELIYLTKRFVDLRAKVLVLEKGAADLLGKFEDTAKQQLDIPPHQNFDEYRRILLFEVAQLKTQYLGGGKVINRKKIAALTEKIASLDRVVKILPNRVPRLSDGHDVEVACDSIRKISQEIVRSAAEYVFSVYDGKNDKTERQSENKLTSREGRKELSPAEIEMIVQIIVAEVGSEITDSGHWDSQVTSDLVRSLIEKYDGINLNVLYPSGSDEEQKRIELDAKINSLPHSLSYKLQDLFRFDNYSVMVEHFSGLSKKFSQFDLKNQAASVYGEVAEKLEGKKGFEYLLSTLHVKGRGMKVASLAEELKNFPFRQWFLMLNDKNFVDFVGENTVERAKPIIFEIARERAYASSPRSDVSVRMGFTMYECEDPSVIVLNILNAWREKGHSNESPYLSCGKQSILYKYLSGLGKTEIEKLRQNDKGSARLVDLILANPDTFDQTSLRVIDSNGVYRNVENSVGQEVLDIIHAKTGELINSEDTVEKKFAINLELSLSEADVSPEFLSQLLVLYEKTSDAEIKNLIVNFFAVKVDKISDRKMLFGFFGEHFADLPDGLKIDGKKSAYWYLGEVAKTKQSPEEILLDVSRILGKNVEELKKFIVVFGELFFPAVERPGLSLDRVRVDESLFNKVVSLSDVALYTEEMSQVREIDPNYYYRVVHDGVKETLPGPFLEFCRDNFGVNVMRKNFTDLLRAYFEKNGELPVSLTSAMMRALFETDSYLREDKISEELLNNPLAIDNFKKAVEKMLLAVIKTDGKGLLSMMSKDRNCLQYLVRQPEKIDDVIGLAESSPKLLSLLSPGGVLAFNAESIIRDIFSNGNVALRAQEIVDIFTSKVPYWKQLVYYTEARLGPVLAASNSRAGIGHIGDRDWATIVAEHVRSKEVDSDKATDLECFVSSEKERGKLLRGEVQTVPFNALSGMMKKQVYSDRIFATVEHSRDSELKKQADSRNRNHAPISFAFDTRWGAHGTSDKNLGLILLSGNIPRESLGESCTTDYVPFHVDFWDLGQEGKGGAVGVNSLKDFYNKTFINNYALERDGVVLFYDRADENTYERNTEVQGIFSYHVVILGGLPSTEISAILVRNMDSIEMVKEKIVENGFYIPAYDNDGKLVFTEQEYDQIRSDKNLSVSVEVWDSYLKKGEQLGSNPGGIFAVSTEDGPEDYYVKFIDEGFSPDRVWNEYLADRIYQMLGIAVPETKVVKIGRNYGHASRWIGEKDNERGEATRFEDGFVADCLLANWDVVFERNREEIKGCVFRLDNGGSLLYRAQGGRRDLSSKVIELETMGSHYTNLKESDISKQISVLKKKLTDASIDHLVDSVRLPQADRELLKQKLRARRDFIISYYDKETESEEIEVPEKVKEIFTIITKNELDDTALSAILPEWGRAVGSEGYQHNGELLGDHIKKVLEKLLRSAEYKTLNDNEKVLAAISALFHDLGKPTGMIGNKILRDFDHDVVSAQIASDYLQRWGLGIREIALVSRVILYDGIVTDVARGKVRDPNKKMTPAQLRDRMRKDKSAIRVLQAINRADAEAVVGEPVFAGLLEKYNQFFSEMLGKT